MRSIRLIVIVLMLGLFSAGCQTFSAGSAQGDSPAATSENLNSPTENSTNATSNPNQSAVEPEAAYPYPAVEVPVSAAYPSPEMQAAQSSIVYPDLKDGDKIDWTQAIGTLYSGQVKQVSQTHDLNVTLTLKDGRTLVTTEPAIDDIIKMVQQCGDQCKDIRVATE